MVWGSRELDKALECMKRVAGLGSNPTRPEDYATLTNYPHSLLFYRDTVENEGEDGLPLRWLFTGVQSMAMLWTKTKIGDGYRLSSEGETCALLGLAMAFKASSMLLAASRVASRAEELTAAELFDLQQQW